MRRQPQSLFQSLTVNSLATLIFAVLVSVVAFVGPAAAEQCEDDVDEFVEELTEQVEEEITFTALQQARWDDLIAAIRTGGIEVTAFCTRVDEEHDASPVAAPEQLEIAEEAILVGLSVMRKIRPAFDAFYVTLNAEQKEMIDNAVNYDS